MLLALAATATEGLSAEADGEMAVGPEGVCCGVDGGAAGCSGGRGDESQSSSVIWRCSQRGCSGCECVDTSTAPTQLRVRVRGTRNASRGMRNTRGMAGGGEVRAQETFPEEQVPWAPSTAWQ